MVIIGNFLGVSPAQSRNIVGAHIMKRFAEIMPGGWQLILLVSVRAMWEEALQGARCAIVEVGSARFARTRWYEALYTQSIFPFHAVRLKGDIVFSPSPVFPVILGRKNVVMIHDIAYRRFPREASLPARLYMRAMYRAGAWWARMIVSISEFSANEIASMYGVPHERLAVLYNSLTDLPSVPAERAREIAGRIVGRPYFLYVGITRWRKNLPRLLKAFAEAHAQLPDMALVLAGKQDTRFVDVAALAKQEGIADRVVQAGFVSEEEKAALFQSATALVMPSFYEGFGLQVIEAQSLGVPVVASNTSSIPEVAGDSVLYVDPQDVRDIAEGMVRIAKDAGLRKKLSMLGKQNVRRFSWKKGAETLLEIFKRAESMQKP